MITKYSSNDSRLTTLRIASPCSRDTIHSHWKAPAHETIEVNHPLQISRARSKAKSNRRGPKKQVR